MASPGASRRPPRLLGVVSDLDGTLLRSDGILSPSTVLLLHTLRRVGVPMLVATARTPRGVRKVVGHEALGRVVCANGAVVWDARRDEVVSESCFEPTALRAAVGRLRKALPDAAFALLTSQTMFIDEAYAALRHKKADGAELFLDLDRVLSGGEIVAVAVRHPQLRAEQLHGLTSDAFGEIGVASFAGAPTVDVSPGTVTKAVAVAEEMAAAGCSAGSVVAFGDMPNDLPLFTWAGWACAVANSHRDVIAAADEIVPSNDDDGVARTVPRLLGL